MRSSRCGRHEPLVARCQRQSHVPSVSIAALAFCGGAIAKVRSRDRAPDLRCGRARSSETRLAIAPLVARLRSSGRGHPRADALCVRPRSLGAPHPARATLAGMGATTALGYACRLFWRTSRAITVGDEPSNATSLEPNPRGNSRPSRWGRLWTVSRTSPPRWPTPTQS